MGLLVDPDVYRRYWRPIFVGTVGMGVSGILYGMATSIWIGIVWVMASGFFN